MSARDRLFLQHMQDAMREIRDFTQGGRDEFMADSKTQSAVIRQLKILGEAVKNLSAPLTNSAPDVPWRQIAGTRDRLIHGYFQVDKAAVWSMVEQDLAPLGQQIRRILDTLPEDGMGTTAQ